ncbi:MAG TPA: winged helix-turn-helix domain-containing protein [Solirubrobacterales bacterium]|jgi:DNA-binding MarR family transcriptional regulator|nr:winged helix-turn-helix domain-containing protein [Solirubrobacterales bacterium]
MAGKSMREVSEWDELKTFFDRRLIEALGHPVREHILAVLNERIASAREIGEEIGADVSSFYHHVEELEKLECIERVASKRRRGALEHFFKAKRTVFFNDEAWRRIPATMRADLATRFIQEIIDDAANALRSGTLTRRGDEHVSWTPGDFDEAGWKEATELMTQTLERLTAIQKESSDRLAKSGDECVSGTVGILAFETSPSSHREGPIERGPAPA